MYIAGCKCDAEILNTSWDKILARFSGRIFTRTGRGIFLSQLIHEFVDCKALNWRKMCYINKD